MRDYKFRGKRLGDGKWVFSEMYKKNGEEVQLGKYEECSMQNCDCGLWDDYWYLVDPATVGQYTGKQDEEKTDIYDGDKLFATGNLSDELQYIGTVVWDNADCRFEVVNYLQGGRFEWIPDGCVVRGSIHDAELLEG